MSERCSPRQALEISRFMNVVNLVYVKYNESSKPALRNNFFCAFFGGANVMDARLSCSWKRNRALAADREQARSAESLISDGEDATASNQ